MTYGQLIRSTMEIFRASLILLSLAIPGSAQLNVGVLGGYAGGIAKSAIPDYDYTKWGAAASYGAAMSYRFHGGFSLGVRAEQVKLTLNEQGDNLGRLTLQPLLATIGVQSGRPEGGRKLGGHFQFGGGIVLGKFENGPAITSIVQSLGGAVNVTVSRSPMFELGGGVDYFLNRWVSITSDFRLLLGNPGTDWRISVGNVYTDMDIQKFYGSTGQVLGGLRFWL